MFTGTNHLAVLLILLGLAWGYKSHRRATAMKPPLPPGPPPKGTFSGNESDMKIPFAWKRYKDLSKIYGNVLYLWMYRRKIVILNSMDDAVELLERRSRIYSSRPVVPMWKLMGFGGVSTGTKEYGEEWRIHRRIFNKAFRPDAALAYRPVQLKKAQDMLHRLLNNLEDCEKAIYTYAGGVILSVTYGYDVQPKGDPLVSLIEPVIEAFAVGTQPRWLVNSFPFLGHLPAWLPGAGFKRFTDSIRINLEKSREIPFKYAIDSHKSGARGTHLPFVTKFLDNYTSAIDRKMLKEAAGSAYAAGVGTTGASILILLVCMVLYPEVQKKAQEEIDKVTHNQRLPDYDDQMSLPYIQAIVREVFRYHPINPLGFPHLTTEDDIYNGFFIPKGTTVHANVWAIAHNPDKYKDPDLFNPERFLTEAGQLNDDDMMYVFGFGRRICPGRHLGAASIWLAAAAILSSFDIVPKKDVHGHDIPVGVKFMDTGVISAPYGFQFSIVPRSDMAEQIISEYGQGA